MDPIALAVSAPAAAPGGAAGAPVANGNAQAAPARQGQQVNANPIAPIEANQASDMLFAGFQGLLMPGEMGLKQKGDNPLFGKMIGQLTDKEMDSVFGSKTDQAKAFAAVQPSALTGDVVALQQDPQAMDEIMELMELRPDLKMDDLMQKDSKGNLMINGAVRDPNSRDLMVNRPDIKPQALTDMRASFAADLKQPALTDMAYKEAIKLLKIRGDVQPKDLSMLMTKMIKGTGGANDPANAVAAVDMFKTGAQLMATRTDIQPQDVAKMADTVSKLGGKQDEKSGMKVANAFAQAADFLITKPGSQVGDVVQLANIVRQRMPGESGDDTDARVNVFGTGLQMMKMVPGLNADGVGTLMQKAAEGPPPRQGQDMINAFNTMGTNLVNGRGNMNIMLDRNQKIDPKGRQSREGEIMLDRNGREVAPVQPVPGRQQGQGGFDQGPGGQGGQNGQNGQNGGQGGQNQNQNQNQRGFDPGVEIGPEATPIPRQLIPRTMRQQAGG